MRPASVALLTAVSLAIALACSVVGYAMATGLSARPGPGALETRLARAVRSLAVPRQVASRANPVPASREAIEQGMAHFADHCASCHANDGSGATSMGRGLFPRPPDLRAAVTQELTDGTLFHIVEHGVRFTGMPAFGTGNQDGEISSWQLVRFMRHLPSLSAGELAQMEAMNPRPPADVRREMEDERFLQGDTAPAGTAAPETHGGH
jgi:mono/diheme cytochrome c family protein